jgi:tetratricopeptide (TPR) repeat protein
MRFLKTIFFAFFALATVCVAGEPLTLSLPKEQAELWSRATSATMALRYGEAFELSKQLRAENEGVGCVLENVVRISVYDDKGDTTALIKAGKYLESCKTGGLWDALRRFEIGYVQGETGHSVKGAMTTRSAAKAFEDSKELEARAFFAIYAYYIDKSFSWVPFKSDNRELYLATLDSASQKSERFWPLFLTPLIWMHYDKEDFATGLKLAERGLKRAPNHPVLLQIKADMLYRLKRYGEAADIYEKSAADYLKRTGKSIRYWCSALNLIRIYSDKGDKAKAEQWRKTLDDPKYNELKAWMPGSLMDDLKKRKLL